MQSVAIHFNLTVVRKTRRFKTVGGATLDSKYSNIICLLLCVSWQVCPTYSLREMDQTQWR